MFHSTALKIPSFYDVLQMPDVPLLVNDNLNGITYKIVALAFPSLSTLFPIDVVHSVEPVAFLPNEFFVLNHSDPILVYGCDYEYDCYNPGK